MLMTMEEEVSEVIQGKYKIPTALNVVSYSSDASSDSQKQSSDDHTVRRLLEPLQSHRQQNLAS